MKEKLELLLREGAERIAAAKNETELQDVKAMLLGKTGSVTGLMNAGIFPFFAFFFFAILSYIISRRKVQEHFLLTNSAKKSLTAVIECRSMKKN